MPDIDKLTALRILEEKGPITVGEYVEALRAEGFEVKGPRKAHNCHETNKGSRVLMRLHRQGLVRKVVRVEEIAYTLTTRSGETKDVQRGQRMVRYEVTERGRGRMGYLEGKQEVE